MAPDRRLESPLQRLAREHWVLFCAVSYLFTFGLLVVINLLIRGRVDIASGVIVGFGSAVGSAIGINGRKRYLEDGPAPDGRLMRWWTKAPGPSENPDDYR